MKTDSDSNLENATLKFKSFQGFQTPVRTLLITVKPELDPLSTGVELEADRMQNKPVWDSEANFFSSFIYFFSPHNQKWLIIQASCGNYL